jgi:hypothetical protein
MKQVYVGIEDAMFYKVIRWYAFEIGKPVHTRQDEEAAFVNYTYFAITRN